MERLPDRAIDLVRTLFDTIKELQEDYGYSRDSIETVTDLHIHNVELGIDPYEDWD